MTITRAALYIGGASLLVAWFSSAASVSFQRSHSPAPALDLEPTPSFAAVAADVQAQTRRLRTRLAAAPVAREPVRNPFAFRTVAPRPQPEATRRVEEPPPDPLLTAPVDPALRLIGIAEDQNADDVVRTAMLATDMDELIMAAVGDIVLRQYKITAIGANAIELMDVNTGRVRRLALQQQ